MCCLLRNFFRVNRNDKDNERERFQVVETDRIGRNKVHRLEVRVFIRAMEKEDSVGQNDRLPVDTILFVGNEEQVKSQSGRLLQ
jgi:hypothetical protein